MAIFTLLVAANVITLSTTALSILSLGTSMLYQRIRQKKMQDRMEADMDKQKGFEIAVDGEAFDLPVLYGRGKIAGGRTYYEVKSDYNSFTNLLVDLEGGVREPATGAWYTADQTYFRIVTYSTVNGLTPPSQVYVLWGGYTKTNNATDPTQALRADSSAMDSNYSDYSESTGSVYGNDGAVYLKGSVVNSTTAMVQVSFGGGEGEVTAGSTATITDYQVYKVVPDTNTNSKSAYFAHGLEPGETINGEKREFLFLQQAVAYGGINRVVDIDVNDKPWDDEDYQYGQRIHFYRNGNVADPMAVANFTIANPENMTFTNTAYASMVFRLNRDDYNYSGSVPNVSFYVEGMRIKSVNKVGQVYSLSDDKAYSNNPSLCLLDYLMNPIYGKGLKAEQIDLESFYNAAQICDEEVMSNQDMGGKINGVRPTEEGDPQTPIKVSVKRFACNMAINTGTPIRENIEAFLETMHNAELVWSGGKYKLQLAYPTSEIEQDAAVVMSFDSSNIIRKSISISWPSMSDKYNQATIRFRDESSDYGEDSVSWPPRYSAVHKQFLEEDRGVDSTFEMFAAGTTDRYHALAKAEQLVRSSRRSITLEMTVDTTGILLEPGDLIRVTESTTGFQSDELLPVDDVFKVEEIKTNEDLTVNVKAVGFRYNDLAWNVDDNIGYAYTYQNIYRLPIPTNIQLLTDDFTSIKADTTGVLTWDDPTDVNVRDWVVEASLINPPDPVDPVPLDPGFSARELDIFNLYASILYRQPDQSGFDFWNATTLDIATMSQRFYAAAEKQWVVLGTTTVPRFEIQGLNTGAYDFSIRSRDGVNNKSARGIYANSAFQRNNLIFGDIDPVSGLTISKTTEGVYSADFLDLDVRFTLIEKELAAARYRITRDGDTWSSTITEVIDPAVAFDPGFTQRELDIYNAYLEIFSRQPDQPGFDYWVATDVSIQGIRANFQTVADNLAITPSINIAGASATVSFEFSDPTGSAIVSTPIMIQIPGEEGAPGLDGKTVAISVGENGAVFAYDQTGQNPFPANVTLSAVGYNFQGTKNYSWSVDGVSSVNTEDFVYTPPPNRSSLPDVVRLVMYDDGVPAGEDYLSIGGTQAGSDAIQVFFDNPSQALAAEANGAVTNYSSTGGTFRVFQGPTELDYDPTPIAGEWLIADSVVTQGTITVGAFSNGSVGNHANMSTDRAVIEYTITGKDLNGNDFSRVFQQSISKAIAGEDGIVGDPGPIGPPGKTAKITIASGKLAMKYNTAGTSPVPSEASFTASVFNAPGVITYVWNKNGAFVSSSDNYTITAPTSIPSEADSIELIVYEDAIEIARDSVFVIYTQDGSNAIQVVMDNSSHAMPASVNGVIQTYFGSGSTIRVYEGATEVQYDGLGATPGTYSVSVLGVSPVASLSVGSISDAGSYALLGQHSAMDSNVDVATITLEIIGLTFAGDSFSQTVTQTISKAKAGADGADGANGADGSTGDRTATGLLYFNTYSSTAPATPSASGFDFSTGVFTGLSSGWSRTPPGMSSLPTISNQLWTSEFYVVQPDSGAVTISFTAPNGSTVFPSDIQSDNFVAGSSGWRIRRNGGSAEFGSASIRGQLTASQLILDTGRLATSGNSLTIKSGGISSPYLASDAATNAAFNRSGSMSTGHNGLATTCILPQPAGTTADIIVIWNFEQSYPDGPGAQWGYKVTMDGATTPGSSRNSPLMIAVNDHPSGTVVWTDKYTSSATDRTVLLYWYSAAGGASTISAYGNLTAFIRYK